MRRWLRRLGLAALIVAALGFVGFAAFQNALDRPGPLGGNALVVVPKGKGVSDIARLLERHGVISSRLLFLAAVRLSNSQTRLRAGEYDFPGRISARGVIQVLIDGKTVVRKFTVPEGVTSAWVAKQLQSAYGLTGEVAAAPLEGSLLPDTYHYSYGDTRIALIARMQRAMDSELERLWKTRAKAHVLGSAQEALILASIVERETAVAGERAMIAGVFYNRLKRGMALQSDPTVAYGVAIKEGIPDLVLRRPLSRADLGAPGPFNTYRNKGLPPRPIANPGRAAIAAVLNPAKTKALYFVADGNGGHAFATTLQEHNRNVRRWRRLQKSRRAGGANPK